MIKTQRSSKPFLAPCMACHIGHRLELHLSVFETLVYAAADYYQIPSLKGTVIKRFKALTFSDRDPQIGALLCVPAAPEVYNVPPSTDRGLKDIIVEIIIDNFTNFVCGKETPCIFRDVPESAADMLLSKKCTQLLQHARKHDLALKRAYCKTEFMVARSSSRFTHGEHNALHCPDC